MSQKVIIVTAPSGAGKTTIVRKLLERFPRLAFSVSASTRKKRPNEVEGKDYYFMSKQDFTDKISYDDFLEFEEVYVGNYYGTLKSEVDRLWDLDKVIVFDVDVKGAENLKLFFQDKALAVFIKPPSLNVLQGRLKNRQTESEDSLKSRLERAEMELAFENRFDKVILNDRLGKAVEEAVEAVKNFIEN